MSSTIPQKTAEQFIRLFNVVFNSSMLYGTTHPTTLKSIEPLIEILHKILSPAPSVSVVIDRESLFVEEWPVDKIINTRRILQQFSKSGIISITFEQPITAHHIEKLIVSIADSTTVTSVDQIKQNLHQSGCDCIKLNYVRYGKITDDQTVVSIDEAGHGSWPDTSAPVTDITPQALEQINEVLTLAHLFENPQESAAAFSQTALKPELTDDAVRSISDLRSSLQTDNVPSIDVLLNAVYQLKIDLSEAIALRKETGKLMAASDPLVDEMDNLTIDVIVKLVKEEFGTGNVPIRRLAEIIRRMLPDTDELKRLLPKLKPVLLESGMTLTDYLQLIRTLNFEFESETLAESLHQAASGIGATVDELVKAIQSQPDDAARLLVMASEIRKGTQEDDAQLSAMLTDYIEKVSTSLALESPAISGKQGGDALKQMLEKLESQLLENLKKYGVEEPVLTRVGNLLAERRSSTVDNATAKWITSEIETTPDVSIQNLSEKLVRMVSEQAQLDRLHDPVIAAMAARGFDRDQMETVLKKIASNISSGKMFKLPPGILSANNMTFLLDRELKQHHRYHTPFTTVMLTVEGLSVNGNTRPPTESEFQLIIPKMFSITKVILRDIDLVGTLGNPYEKIVFSLLAMTEEKGARIAADRIRKKIDSLHLSTDSGDAAIIAAVSVFTPGSDKKMDMKTYLAGALQNHRRLVDELKGT